MAALKQVEHDAVDVDAEDRPAAAPERGQDVAAAADADDGDVAVLPDRVRQRRHVVAHPLERRRVAVPLGDGRSGFAVDREPRDAAPKAFGAASGSPHERGFFTGPLHEHIRMTVPARHVVESRWSPRAGGSWGR